MAFRTPVFRPTVMFPIESDTDRLVEKLVYQLQADIAETMNTERSAQRSIGISEIGTECMKCLARKLAEMPEHRAPREGWKAQIGTFGHAGLELHFAEKYGNAAGWQSSDFDDNRLRPPTDEVPNYHLEQTLTLHEYKGLKLGGHCDLFVEGESFGLVTDWKFLGPKSLAGPPKPIYQTQMSGYGLAWQLMGKLVTHVLLYQLPRDGELDDAKPVLFRYNPQLALDALVRIERLIDAAEFLGWDAVIAAQPRAGHCFDCPRYEQAAEDEFFAAFRK